MLIPCEVAVKSLIPAIRSAIARELIKTYRLKQIEAANLLGITQTAVSKYMTNTRGKAINLVDIEDIDFLVNEIASDLVNDNLPSCDLSKKVCLACKIIRKKRLMCELCVRSDSTLQTQNCTIC
jgi:predicted transcriptional regulator